MCIYICRSRRLKHYGILAITLRYDFVLSQNAFLLSRTVIASNSYRSAHIGPVITSYSYGSDVIHKRYHIYSLSQWENKESSGFDIA
jgi:hypothetical protein